jgi:crotonobetainyl-CoA:carnitine CoA-transferase CaiB-like acyl-CoA transferase
MNGANRRDGQKAEGSGAEAPSGPLAGIVVLDFTRFQQGTHGAQLIADLGADVLKVEQPGGDPGRKLGLHADGYSSYFETLNRNKRSICLDLRRPEGREVALRLARRADIAVENFRPGTLEKLGLGYDVLAQENPALIYAQASMFGGRGPRSHDPGYDNIAQAAGGIMMFNRDFNRPSPGDSPFPAQPGIADQTGGTMLAYGILAALVHRLRTGRGQKVDVSLYGSQISIQSIHLARALYGVPLRPPGQSSGVLSHRALCGDGRWIGFGILEAQKWPNLARGLDLGHLINDPRFAAGPDRAKNIGELVEIIDATVITRPSHEWIVSLRAADCPCTVVQDYEMVAQDEQALANDYVATYEKPRFGTVRVAGTPANLEQTPASVRRPAPLYPGEHSREILQESGFSEDEIAALFAAGTVRSDETYYEAPAARAATS